MLGYMTAKEALSYGCTHHGSYFGIPIWIEATNEVCPMVAAKWVPLEYLVIFFHWVENFFREFMFPDSEPGFQFYIGAPIDDGVL